MYEEKRKGFIGRIKKLGEKPEDFEEVKIIILGNKEKVTIKYHGEKFQNHHVYESMKNE